MSAGTRMGWGRSAAVVLGLLALIGAGDYLMGLWLSVQLFYLIPIVLAALWLGRRDTYLVAVLCGLVRVLTDVAGGILEHFEPANVFWNRVGELVVFCAVAWALDAWVSLQRELEERVQQRTAALEQASAARDELQKQLFEISRRERGEIGHDLHDGLGQHLTATTMAANLLANRLATAGNPAADDAHRVVGLLQEGIAQTRQLARGLLLSAVEPADLVPELDELADSIRAQHGIACDFTLHGLLPELNATTTSHLFYIAQEAARNAARHGHPTQVAIELTCGEEALLLMVTDDGTGLRETDGSGPGMGLRIMQHRSELIGAGFAIGPGPDGGTCVRCRVPVRAAAVVASP